MSKLTLKLGKSWIGIDRTGIMAWFQLTHRNYFWIWRKHA